MSVMAGIYSCCYVHPVVLVAIVDSYERRSEDAKRVIGTLLGNSILYGNMTWYDAGSSVKIRICGVRPINQPGPAGAWKICNRKCL